MTLISTGIERVSSKGATNATYEPTFIDVFSGCGGLSLGLKRAGWKGCFAIEKDSFAFDTLIKNFPANSESFGYKWPSDIEQKPWDIRELLDKNRKALSHLEGNIDLLAGGPPCQGFSNAGRRRQDDPRNRLFEAYLELVDLLKPKMVLVENVKGFTSDFKILEEGSIENFSRELKQKLSKSYNIACEVIRACDFGIPQVRPRFFLIGLRKDLVNLPLLDSFFDDLRAQSSNFLRARGLSKTPTARDAISDLEVARNGTVICNESKGFSAIAYRLPRTSYQKAMRDGHKGAPSDTRLARHRPDIAQRFGAIIEASRSEGRLRASISAKTRELYGLKKMAIRVLDPDRAAPTITSLPDDLLHYSEPRTLTVRENARLQSFPDWFCFKGKYTTGGELRRREVPRFTQVANAVPPILAEQLGLRLLNLLRA